MSAWTIGTRVAAVMDAAGGEVRLFGFGVYEGDFVFGDESSTQPEGFVATLAKRRGFRNPRIRLDDGKIVWGCECWWLPEETFHKRFAGLRIVPADIEAERVRAREGR